MEKFIKAVRHLNLFSVCAHFLLSEINIKQNNVSNIRSACSFFEISEEPENQKRQANRENILASCITPTMHQPL